MSISDIDLKDALLVADSLVFSLRGKHITDLEVEIITGVLEKRSYVEIAKEQDCTEGHVKDVSYRLWKTLSKALGDGEVIDKRNLKSTLLRRSVFNLNFCHNSNAVGNIVGNIVDSDTQSEFLKGKKIERQEIAIRMKNIGLSEQVIAESLSVDIEEVKSILSSAVSSD